MIIGNGVDIIDNKRIEKSLKIKGFKKRLFTLNEIKLSKKTKNKIAFFSKRFAAKEAFSKALGTGISRGIKFNEIVILNKKNGKPYVKLLNNTKLIVEKLLKKKKYKISLSISDESNYAVAFVTISI